jgi:hypothetical protein
MTSAREQLMKLIAEPACPSRRRSWYPCNWRLPGICSPSAASDCVHHLGGRNPDPHIQERGVLRTQTFDSVGEFTYVGDGTSEAGRVAGQPYAVRRRAPDLDQHTAEVLGELGYTTGDIAGFVRAGARPFSRASSPPLFVRNTFPLWRFRDLP